MQSKILSTLLCSSLVASFAFGDTNATSKTSQIQLNADGGGGFK